MTNHPFDPTSVPSRNTPRRTLFSVRRLALMASVAAGLGVAVYGFSPSGTLDFLSSPAHAQVNSAVGKVAQPIGFADIVERVKPSVISVKVTMKEKVTDTSNTGDEDSQGQSGPPMERFFRQFGGPDGMPPGMRGHHGGHGVMMGQGSGFFISPDGYAVTNNHVVDGADKVEVTTEAGKTYTAKVIGTDPPLRHRLDQGRGRLGLPVRQAIGRQVSDR